MAATIQKYSPYLCQMNELKSNKQTNKDIMMFNSNDVMDLRGEGGSRLSMPLAGTPSSDSNSCIGLIPQSVCILALGVVPHEIIENQFKFI